MATDSFNVNIPVGEEIYGPFSVEDGLTSAVFSATNWPQAGRTLAAAIDISLDGGNVWSERVSMGAADGARDPHPYTGSRDCGMGIKPIPEGTGRLLRIRTTVTGGPVATTVTVVTS